MQYFDDLLCALAHRDPAVAADLKARPAAARRDLDIERGALGVPNPDRAVFAKLEFLLNLLKCVFELTQRIVLLGFIVDTVSMTLEAAGKRMVKMVAAVAALLSTAR